MVCKGISRLAVFLHLTWTIFHITVYILISNDIFLSIFHFSFYFKHFAFVIWLICLSTFVSFYISLCNTQHLLYRFLSFQKGLLISLIFDFFFFVVSIFSLYSSLHYSTIMSLFFWLGINRSNYISYVSSRENFTFFEFFLTPEPGFVSLYTSSKPCLEISLETYRVFMLTNTSLRWESCWFACFCFKIFCCLSKTD